jgi:hypothetical protein
MVSNFIIVQDFILTGFFIISGLPSAALSAKKEKLYRYYLLYIT